MTASGLPRRVIEVADGFWNLRGSFKIAGLVDIGTHCSLARRGGGGLVLLDACGLGDAAGRWLDEATGGGAALEAVLHLHPFHTVHVEAMHRRYPEARLHGTARHVEMFPELPWQPELTESAELQALYAEDFDFTVPRGVDFIAGDPKVHFASVLAIHRASKTLHVDDTLLFIRLPWLLRLFGRELTRFHPTLAKVLEPRPGAAADFRAWARELIERAADLENLCAAHSAALLGRDNRGPSIAARIEAALARVEGKLAAHEKKHPAPAATS